MEFEAEAIDAAMRLGIAVLCGMLLGMDRDARDKPAGMRTLALVALGAALVTKTAATFVEFDVAPDARSRVLQGAIQGIIAGIGFIGAGCILRNRGPGEVQGVTTAATVWLSAALGIACGLARWPLVAVTVVLVLIILFVAKPLERMIFGSLGLPDPETNGKTEPAATSGTIVQGSPRD